MIAGVKVVVSFKNGVGRILCKVLGMINLYVRPNLLFYHGPLLNFATKRHPDFWISSKHPKLSYISILDGALKKVGERTFKIFTLCLSSEIYCAADFYFCNFFDVAVGERKTKYQQTKGFYTKDVNPSYCDFSASIVVYVSALFVIRHLSIFSLFSMLSVCLYMRLESNL